MSISEVEDILGVKDNDKVDCPHDCDKCPYGLDLAACEELYEEFLLGDLEGIEND